MNNSQDVPLSVAALTLFAVLVAWLYFNYLRFNPELLLSLSTAFSRNSSFWWMSIIASSLNVAMIGSVVRRTIGLQRQGSRLKQIGNGNLGIKLASSDGIAFVLAFVLYFVLFALISKLLEKFNFVPQKIISVLEVALSTNWSVFAFIILAVCLRKFKNLKISKDESLENAPFKSKSLVLGTMEIADERTSN